MENDVINLKSLSADAPLLQYNDWQHLTVTPRIRPNSVVGIQNVNEPLRQHKKQLAFHQSLAKMF